MEKKEELRGFIGQLLEAYLCNDATKINAIDVDWNDVYKLCEYHRLDNILYEMCSEKITDSFVLQKMEKKATDTKRKISEYEIIVEELSKRLDEENVKFVFLKGYALCMQQYRKKYHRYFNDLDILVAYTDLNKALSVIKKMGFEYGKVKNGNFIRARRSDIVYQRLNTHELYNMVLEKEGNYYNLDINFLFSWKGVTNDKECMKEVPFEDIQNNISRFYKGENSIPVLNETYQFIHLCCHFYNEAIFFALNKEYSGGDAKEIILIRLLDILLLLCKGFDLNEISEVSKKYVADYKINYVLNIILKICPDLIKASDLEKLGYKNVKSRDYYYISKNKQRKWKCDILTRIICPENKENCQ